MIKNFVLFLKAFEKYIYFFQYYFYECIESLIKLLINQNKLKVLLIVFKIKFILRINHP